MAPPLIRRAAADDAAALARLGEATFRETFLEDFAIPYPAEDLAAFVAEAYSLAATQALLASPAHAVWLAEAHGQAVGYCVAGPCGLPHPDVRHGDGELKRLYITREQQGAGLGRQLFTLALDWLGSRNRPIWLGVWSGNLKAQQFYARAGFAKAGEYNFAVGIWRDREFILRRE